MSNAHDETIAALADVIVGLRESIAAAEQTLARTEQSLAVAQRGAAYSAIAAQQRGPLIVHLLTEHLRILEQHGSRYRAASARALHSDRRRHCLQTPPARAGPKVPVDGGQVTVCCLQE